MPFLGSGCSRPPLTRFAARPCTHSSIRLAIRRIGVASPELVNERRLGHDLLSKTRIPLEGPHVLPVNVREIRASGIQQRLLLLHHDRGGDVEGRGGRGSGWCPPSRCGAGRSLQLIRKRFRGERLNRYGVWDVSRENDETSGEEGALRVNENLKGCEC